MKLILKTKVKGYYLDVMARFDLDLFKSLKPIGARMEITQFTGSKTGDIVALSFTSPVRAKWVSKIVDHGQDDDKAYFIDEGTKLPFPLKDWRHRHIVQNLDEKTSLIIDDINYSTGNKIFDMMLYPFMYLGFYPRKSQYKKFFNSANT